MLCDSAQRLPSCHLAAVHDVPSSWGFLCRQVGVEEGGGDIGGGGGSAFSLRLVHLCRQEAAEDAIETVLHLISGPIKALSSAVFRAEFFLFGSVSSKSSLFGQSSVNHNLL